MGASAPAQQKGEEMQLGLVIHNEINRLPKWLDHYKDYSITIIDQSSTDGCTELIPDSVKVITTPAAGIADPDFNLLQEITPDWLLLLGVDEFISPEHLAEIEKTAGKFPTIKCWIIRRKDFVNDIDCSDLKAARIDQPGITGCDWQPRFTKGTVCKYAGIPHKHPQILTRWGYIDGNAAWIEHRRDWETILTANRSREHLLDANGRQEQVKYLKALSSKLGVDYE